MKDSMLNVIGKLIDTVRLNSTREKGTWVCPVKGCDATCKMMTAIKELDAAIEDEDHNCFARELALELVRNPTIFRSTYYEEIGGVEYAITVQAKKHRVREEEDLRKLDSLECAGVDNWEGYDIAMEGFDA